MKLTAAARRGALTPALPMPYPALDKAGLRLRRGQVSLTVAAPGVGKSMLLMNLAARMQVPAIYWSADTDEHDVLMRALALGSHFTTAEVELGLGEISQKKFWADSLFLTDQIDWIFDSAIPAMRVAERLAAFGEMHGRYPDLVVLDNLSNAVQNQNDEFAEQKEFMVEIQRLARFTKSHFAVLAHSKGDYENGDKPIPLGGILNNLAKLPEVVITLHRPENNNDRLGVNIPKNRGGRPDPKAQHPTILPVDYARAFVGGHDA